MLAVTKQKLVDVRTDLLLSQDELARLAKVGVITIIRCEQGDAIRLLTAKKILWGLNSKRQELGLLPVTLDDLDIKIS